jgi:uncharacterized protein (UPF0335 family)
MAEARFNVSTTNATTIQSGLKGFLARGERLEDATSKEIAEDLADEVRKSIGRRFDNEGSTGNMKDNVKVEKASGNSDYKVTANAYNSQTGVNYAAWHEYAETGHKAPFRREGGVLTQLGKWARKVGIETQGKLGMEVSPISFMSPAVKKAVKSARRRTRRHDKPPQNALEKVFK